MKNLHNIRTTKIPQELITELFLANLWAVQELLGYETHITSDSNWDYEPENRDDYDQLSPIYYSGNNGNYWDQWYWEYARLEDWYAEGKPMPNLNIPYGPIKAGPRS